MLDSGIQAPDNALVKNGKALTFTREMLGLEKSNISIEEKPEKYEKSNHEDNTSAIGHSKIKVCFFLLSGIACVLVFNCFLSIEGYWTSRYGSNTFNRLLFGMNVGGFLSFFVYPLVASKFSVSAINISAPIMLLVVSILTLVVGEAVDGQGTGKMVVCIGLAAAVGVHRWHAVK